MFCSHCGSELKDTDAKCPYCGALNPLGAEAAYMDQLDDLKEDTEELGDVPIKEYQKTLKKQGKFAVKVALGVIGVCLVIFLIIRGKIFYEDLQSKKIIESQMKFEQKYFPKLNDLYQQGDDEAVLSYLNELYGEEGAEALFQWEPMVYYTYYEEYLEVEWLWERIEDGTLSQEDLIFGFPYVLKLAFEEIPASDVRKMTEKQLETINGFCEETRKMMKEVLPISEEEARTIYQDCCREGYLNYEICEKYASEIYSKIKEGLE